MELLLLIPEAVLLLVIALIAGVVPVGLLVLVRGVELLPLEAISDEVGGVAALEAAPRWCSPLLAELSCQQGNLIIEDEIVLVGLASWPPAWVLVIKALLEREAS
jgi:hypothetical protein